MIWLLILLALSISQCTSIDCNSEIQLRSEKDLETIRICPEGSFILHTDISVTVPFLPFPPFYGAIVGKMHTITIRNFQNIGANAGVFTEMHGTLTNITFDVTLNEYIKNPINVGLIAGILNSTNLYNVTVHGNLILAFTINSDNNTLTIGGLAGRSYITPSNVSVNATIKYNGFRKAIVGGVIGSISNPAPNINDSVISGLSFNGSLECNSGACTLGGIAGECGRSLLDCKVNLSSVLLTDNSLSKCIYGGLVGIQSGSVGSSVVLGNVIKLSRLGQNSYVGGFVGILKAKCCHCAILDGCSATYKSFSVGSGMIYVGGFAAILDGVLVRHSNADILDAKMSGIIGGFASDINATEIEECLVSISNLSQIYLDNSISAGFVAISHAQSKISNSYSRIINYVAEGVLTVFGGFVGRMIEGTIINCFTWISEATLQVTSKYSSHFGGFCGDLLAFEGDTLIYNSFAFLFSFNYSYKTNHDLLFGGFVSYISADATIKTTVSQYLSQLWWYINLTIDCASLNKIAKIQYGSFAAVVDSTVNISDCYGTANFSASCNSFLKGYGIASFIGFAHMDYLYAMRILLNTTYNYLDFLPQFFSVSAFGPSLHSSYCKFCENILIAANTGVDRLDIFSILPEFLMLPATYLARSWWLDENGGWKFSNSVFPILTSNPFILVPRKGPIMLITKACSPPICWDYTNIWALNYTDYALDLQFHSSRCSVKLCSSCSLISPTRCRNCSSGALDDSNSICLPCSKSCFTCPTSTSVCEICANPSYVSTDGFCVQSFKCVNIPSCSHCHPSQTNGQICVKCFDGYWLNKDYNRCEKCPPSCLECISPTQCTKCKNVRKLLISGYCDYDTLCVDNQNCKYCQISDPFYCVGCNSMYMRPNSDGVCVKVDQSYCTVPNCIACEVGNANRCSVCGLNRYLAFNEGVCNPCPDGCKICTPVICTRCIDPTKEPILGTCMYSEDCSLSNCLYCTKALKELCIKCQAKYYLNVLSGTCIGYSVKQNKLNTIIGISIFVSVGALSIIVTTIICLRKRCVPSKKHDQI